MRNRDLILRDGKVFKGLSSLMLQLWSWQITSPTFGSSILENPFKVGDVKKKNHDKNFEVDEN